MFWAPRRLHVRLLRVPLLPAPLSPVPLLFLVLLLLLVLLLRLLGGATIFPWRVALGLPPRRLLLLLGPRLRSLWCLVLCRRGPRTQNVRLAPLLLLCLVCHRRLLRRRPWARRHRLCARFALPLRPSVQVCLPLLLVCGCRLARLGRHLGSTIRLRFRCDLACLARLLRCLWTRRRRILLWRLLLLARVFCLHLRLRLCLLGVLSLLAPRWRLLLLLQLLRKRRMLWRLGAAVARNTLAPLVLVLPPLALLALLLPALPRRSW
jgi:hypothetical protein